MDHMRVVYKLPDPNDRKRFALEHISIRSWICIMYCYNYFSQTYVQTYPCMGYVFLCVRTVCMCIIFLYFLYLETGKRKNVLALDYTVNSRYLDFGYLE